MKRISIFLVLLSAMMILLTMCTQQEVVTHDQPPEWAKDVIWYQIFVERFNNGDLTNDPTPENIFATSNFYETPEDWGITPWTQNWYEVDDYAKDLDGNFYSKLQLRRYGGDLQGVLDKLDYLNDLGVNAIYLNPINDAPSLHKYDTRNWRHVDVNFGPDPEGDNQIIASEDPADPSTWKWTSADKMFLKLVDEVHKRGMRIIMDYSWNHTGVEFWAWKDIMKNQGNSEYIEWYDVKEFDDPATEENEFDYHGWLNLRSLPEIKKVDITTERKIGRPYEGDINEGAKKHVFEVTKRWLAPDGDVSKGIDGYRMDVADHIGMKFWRDWRKYVKSINPEAYIVGEIWWEEWPDMLMDPVPYLSGDVFDAVMFYQIYRPARRFFGKMDYGIDAAEFKDALMSQWDSLGKEYRYGMMNVAATHDSPRLWTSFNNSGKYKYNAKPDADTAYKAGKPDQETYKRGKLYLMHQFTNIGAPHIWNGDEMGMWGADDPDPRKPLWWAKYDFDPECNNYFRAGEKEYDEVGFNEELFDFYKKLTRIRQENPLLRSGEIEFLTAEGMVLSYRRYDDDSEIFVAFNLGDSPFEIDLPESGSYTNLMDETTFSGDKVTLEPLSGMIYTLTGSGP